MFAAAPLDDLVKRMDKGEFDMIAIGRAILQDPNWASKVKDGNLDALKDYDPAALMTLS